jgi:hypothetical protein
MAFDLTVEDKGREQTLVVGGGFKGLAIAGKLSHPVQHGDKFLEVHLSGDTPFDANPAVRTYLWLEFIRYKSDGTTDPTGLTGPIEITARSAERTEWATTHSIHLTTYDEANPDGDGHSATYGVGYRVEARSKAVVLKNRILKGGETT